MPPRELASLLASLMGRGTGRQTVRRVIAATWRAGGSTGDAVERLRAESGLELPRRSGSCPRDARGRSPRHRGHRASRRRVSAASRGNSGSTNSAVRSRRALCAVSTDVAGNRRQSTGVRIRAGIRACVGVGSRPRGLRDRQRSGGRHRWLRPPRRTRRRGGDGCGDGRRTYPGLSAEQSRAWRANSLPPQAR